jgi:hypothetical protein
MRGNREQLIVACLNTEAAEHRHRCRGCFFVDLRVLRVANSTAGGTLNYTTAMPSTTRTLGLILILLGLISYFGTGRVSVTALIPAFFGAVFIILALVARSESARKHAMHAAVAFALIGLLGTLARLLPAIGAGELGRPAVIAQLVMSILLIGYIALGVNSFRAARRARMAR